MASIFGLKLKGRCSFIGLDGEGNQGNLYLDNKKIAWYNDSGNGAPADIEFYNGRLGRETYESKLIEIVKRYFERFPIQGDDGRYARFDPDIEMLVCCLLDLMDDEKQYKKFEKQGYPIMIAYRKTVNSVSYYCAYRTKEGADADIENHKLIVLKRYEKLEDFVIE